ncbi:MAG TPA: glycosyltransferase family 2 protein [Methanotrichaceae archaeon]|nr:glycosyltransferase family 2 protein [Methanotrichaceae archaeon]
MDYMRQVDVVVGTTTVRKSSFALDHFLLNQYEIQSNYRGSELVIATDDPDFVDELESLIKKYNLFGCVIMYETEPHNHKSNYRLQSITCGRNAVREYVLNSGESYLLFLDADMTYDPQIIDIMKKEIDGYDVVQSGYMVRSKSINALGFGGCSLIKRDILSKIRFRYYEFKNGQVIDEFNIFELDLFRRGARINKGVFLSINHYLGHGEVISINPRDLSLFQKVTTWSLLRYVLLQLSIISKYDITRYFQRLLYGRS